MPEFFKDYLQGMTDTQADVLWLYFDGSADSLDIVDVICESHPNIVENNEASK